MGALYQLGLLFKKNFLLRKRQPGVLLLEVIWPLLVIVVVAVIRQSALPLKIDSCHFQQRAMPSVGVVPFMQSFLCTLDNKCQARDKVETSEEQSYRVAALLGDITPFLASEDTVEALKVMDTGAKVIVVLKRLTDNTTTQSLGRAMVLRNYFKDPDVLRHQLTTVHKVMTVDEVEALLNSSLNVAEFIRIFGFVDFKTVACNPDKLSRYLLFEPGVNVTSVGRALCSIPDSLIPQLTQVIQNQLDVGELVRLVGLFEKFKAQMAGQGDDLSEAMMAVADMMELLFRSPSLSSLLTNPAALKTLPDLVRKLPRWIQSFQNAEDLITQVHEMVTALDPVIAMLAPNNSIWQSVKYGLELGVEMSVWFQSNGSTSSSQLLSRLKTLLGNLDLTTDTFSRDFYSVVDAMASLNWTVLGQALMGQATIPPGTYLDWMDSLQKGLKPTSIWNMTSPMLVMADSLVEAASVLLDQFVQLERFVGEMVLGNARSKGALVRLLERGPNVTLTVLQATTDPSFLANVFTNPMTFPEVCGRMADRIEAQLGTDVASDIRALLCSSNITGLVMEFANSTSMQQLFDMIRQTGTRLEMVLGSWLQSDNNNTMSWEGLKQGNFTSLYLHMSSLVQSFSEVANLSQVTWSRLLSDGHMAAILASREWTAVWDTLTSNYAASSALAMIRSFALVLADNETAAVMAPIIHMVEVVIRNSDIFLQYYMDLYGQSSSLSRLTQMVSTYMPEVMMAARSIASNKDVMYRLIGATDPMATFCSEHLMTYAVFPGSQNVPMAEMETLLCKTNWTAIAMPPTIEVAVQEITTASQMRSNVTYDVEGDLVSINDYTSRLVSKMTDTDAFIASMAGPAYLLQNANWTRMAEAIQYLSTSLSNPTLQDFQGFSHMTWLTMEQLDRMSPQPESWPFVQHGVLLMDAFVNRSLSLLNSSSLQSVLSTMPRSVQDYVSQMSSVTPQLLQSLQESLLNPEALMNKVLHANLPAPDCNTHFLSDFLVAGSNLRATEQYLCQLNWTALAMDLLTGDPMSILMSNLIMNMSTGRLSSVHVDWLGVAKRTDQFLSVMTSPAPMTFDWLPFNLTAINASWSNVMMAASTLSSLDVERTMRLTTQLQNQVLTLQSEIMTQTAPQVSGILGLYANLSVDFFSFVIQNLKVINASTEWDVLGWLGSPQLTKAVRTLQLLPQVTQVGLDNIVNLMIDPDKVAVWTSPDAWTQVCTNVTAFSRLLGLQSRPGVDVVSLQSGVCALNLNITALLEELLTSVPGFRNLYTKMTEALANPNIDNTIYDVNWMQLNSILMELGNLTTSLALRFPPLKSDMFSSMDWVNGSVYERQLQQFQQRLQDVLVDLQNTSATQSWQTRLVYSTLSSMASIPGFPRILQYLHVIVPIIDSSFKNSMRPWSESLAGLPTMSQLLQQAEQLPELMEMLVYTALLQPEKLTALGTVTSWEGFCSSDPASLFATPPSSTFDLRSWLTKLCDVNATVLVSELSRIQGNDQLQQLIAEEVGGTNVVTPPADMQVVAGEITQLLQTLTSLTSNPMPFPDPGLRLFNGSVWEEVMHHIASYANSSFSASSLESRLVSSMLSSMAAVPGFPRILQYMHVIVPMIEQSLNSTMRPWSESVAGLPTLSQLLQQAEQLPEVMEVLVYTALLHPEKLIALGTVTSWEGFCSSEPASLFATPPSSTFDLRSWLSKLCDVNATVLVSELSRIQGNDQLQQLIAEEMGVVNATTPPVDVQVVAGELTRLLQRLISLTSNPMPFPDPGLRLFNGSVWEEMLQHVASYANASATKAMSPDYLVSLLTNMASLSPDMASFMSIFNRALAIADVVLDSLLRSTQGGTVKDMVAGYPNLQRGLALMNQLPEVLETLIYTLIFSPEKTAGGVAAMTSFPAFCAANPTSLFTKPPALTFDLNGWVTSLCAMDWNVTLDELARLQGAAQIMDLLNGNSTPAVDANVFSNKVQQLVTQLSNLTVSSLPAARFLDPESWQTAVSNVQSWLADISQIPLMRADRLVELLQALTSSSPEVQRGLNQALAMVDLSLDQMLNNLQSQSLNDLLAGYPMMQSLVSLMDELPEIFQTLTYTAIFSSTKLSGLGTVVTSLPSFCTSNLGTVLTVPPSLSWSPGTLQSVICSLNLTLLEQELVSLGGAGVGQQIVLSNTNVQVNATALNAKLDRLIAFFSSNATPPAMTLPRFLNQTVWESALTSVQAWLTNPSQLPAMTAGGALQFLGGLLTGTPELQQNQNEVNMALRIAGVLLDRTSLFLQGGDLRAMVEGYPTLQSMVDLMNQLPELYQALTYTVFFHSEQLIAKVGTLTSWEAFCGAAPPLLATPPNSMWDSGLFFRRICDVNATQLLSDLARLQGTATIQELLMENATAPVNMTSLGMSLDALMVRLSSVTPLPVFTSSFLNASLWEAANNQVARWAQTVSTMSFVSPQALLRMLGNLTSVDAGVLKQAVNSMEITAAVVEVILDRLLMVENATSVAVQDFFMRSPQFEKLLDLALSPNSIEVLLWSVNNPQMQQLYQMTNATAAILTLCDPSTSASQWFTAPTGSSVNLDDIRQKFCRIDFEAMGLELAADFDFVRLTAVINGNASVNLVALSSKIERVVTMATRWSSSPPDFRMSPELLNATFWLNLMETYSQARMSPESINAELRAYLTSLGPLLTQTPFRELGLVLQMLVEQTTENLVALENTTLTLDTLASRVPILRKLFTALGLPANFLEPLLELPVRDPAVLAELFFSPNTSCSNGDIWRRLLSLPTDYNTSRLQTLLCTGNTSRLMADLLREFSAQTLIDALGNVTAVPDWQAIMTGAETLTSAVQKLMTSLPILQDQTTLQRLAALYNNASSTAQIWNFLGPFAAFQSAFQGQPGMSAYFGALQGGAVMLDWVNQMLGKLVRGGSTLDLASLFRDSPTFVRMMDVLLSLQPDITTALLSVMPRLDKIQDFTQAVSDPTRLQTLFCDEAAFQEYFLLPAGFNASLAASALCRLNTTALVEELKASVMYPKLVAQFEALMNGSSTAFNISAYVTAQQELTSHIMALLNVSRVTFDGIDIAQSFYVRNVTALMVSLTNALMSLAPGAGTSANPTDYVAVATNTFDSLLRTFALDPNFQYVVASLNFIDLYLRNLKDKINLINARGFTLSTLLEDTELGKLLPIVLDPAWMEEAANLTLMPNKLQEILQSPDATTRLCGPDLWSVFEGGPHPALSRLQTTACSLNSSLVLWQTVFLRANGLQLQQQAAALIEEAAQGRASLRTNSTQISADVTALIQAVTSLIDQPGLSNLTATLGVNVNAFQSVLDRLQSTFMARITSLTTQLSSSTMSLLWPMLPNSVEFQEMGRIINAGNLVFEMVNARLQDVLDNGLSWRSLLGNSSGLISLMETAVRLTQHGIQDLGAGQIDVTKLRQLGADQALLTSQCQSGQAAAFLAIGSIPNPLSRDLAAMLCVAVDFQPITNQFLEIWHNNASVTPDFMAFTRNVQKYSDLVTRLAMTPPKVDPALTSFNLSGLWSQLQEIAQDPNKLLKLMKAYGFVFDFVPVDSNTAMIFGATQQALALAQDYINNLKAAGLDLSKLGTDPAQLIKLVDLATDTQAQMSAIRQFYVEPTFMAAGNNAWFRQQVLCQRDNLTRVLGETPSSQLTLLCYNSPDTWYQSLSQLGYTPTQLMQLAEKLSAGILQFPQCPTCPPAPTMLFSRNASLSGVISNVEQLTSMLTSLGNSAAQGFSNATVAEALETVWLAAGHLFNRSLASANQLGGLLGVSNVTSFTLGVERQFVNFLQFAASLGDFFNNWIQKFTGSGATVRLSDVLPDSRKLAELLNSLMGPATAAEFLTAEVDASKFYSLAFSSQWPVLACSPQQFAATFTFPPGSDVTSLQQALCRATTERQESLQKLLDMLDAGKILTQFQALLAANPGQVTLPRDLMGHVFNTTKILIGGLQRLGGVNISTSDVMAWFQPIQDALVSLQSSSMPVEQTCNSYERYLGNTTLYQSMTPALAWIPWSQNLMSSYISLSGVLEDVICDIFGSLNISQAVQKLTQAGFWQLLQQSFTQPGPFSCPELGSVTSRLSDAINSTVTLLMTSDPNRLATCLQKTPATFQSVFSNLDLALKLTSDITDVLREPGVRQLLERSQDLAPILDFIVSLFRSQQAVVVKFMDAIGNSTDVTSYLTNTLRLSPEVIDAFLQSTIRLDSASFIRRPVEEIERMLCDPALLSNVLTLPPFSPVNITGLVAMLCDANVKETAKAIKTASDAALLVQQALVAASGLQSQAWISNLTSHALALFKDLESLQSLSSIFSSGLNFDLLQQNIPAIDRFLRSGPARIVQGLTAILNDVTSAFPGEETKRVAREIEFFIRGILGLDVIQSRFLSAVRVSDMAKDPGALQQYLVSTLGISQQDAAAILSSTYSIRVFLNITQTMLREDMTCKDIFDSLILLSKGSGVTKDTLTSALCSLSTEVALNVTSTLVPQLNIGDFVQQYVTRSMDEVLRSANVTADEVRTLGSTLSKAQASLSRASRLLNPEPAPVSNISSPNTTAIPITTPSILDQLLNMPQALTGAAGLTSLQPVLCGSEELDLANSSSTSSLTNMIGVRHVTYNLEELAEMPSDFCRDMYREIVSSQLGSIIWAYLKPILRGKILYTPDTQLSREVMRRATSIFAILEEVRNKSALWRDNAPNLKQVHAELKEIQELKTALKSDFVSALVSSLGLDTTALLSSLEGLTSSGLTPDRVDALQRAAAMVYNYTQCVELNRLEPTPTEADMESQAFLLGKTNSFLAGVVFTNLPQSSRRKRQAQPDSLPHHVYYKIRMDPENVRTTNRLKNRLWSPSPEGDFANDMRYMRGFVQLQDMVERAIISMQTGTNVSLPGVSLQQFPSPCHHEDTYIRILGAYLMPVLMTIAWIAAIAIATRNLIYDREHGQEETLIIMGMRPKLTWLTWLVSTMMVMTLVALLITVILKVSSIYRFTEFSIIFLYLVDFAFSTVMMSYMVGAFFTRTTVAMLTVLIVYLLSYLPYVVLVSMETQMTFWQKTLACLASTSAFGFSAQYLSRMEEEMVGVQWNNINVSPIKDDPMTFSWSCWMMLIDSGIYLVIGWYIRNVKPGKYGVGQPWYFFVTPSYWCEPCLKGSTRDPGRLDYPESPLFQSVGREGRLGMTARNLAKKFRSNTVITDLSLDFMEGQVTALLGHNGAAKTTTMNMLIGVLKPTKGAVSIYGKNVLGSRGDIGFCPQHDALFDFMTVKEHMEFYAGVKSSLLSGSRKKEIKELLQDVDLYSVRHLPVRELSGGMRRRLCVALAFVGGSRAIVLDEPTSGVDPHARSAIWKLIAKNKAGRTILLSTHHLDEADTLSDRTAIMHQGRLLAMGSPKFLKEKLAAGYRLTLTKAVPTPEKADDPNSYVYYCNPETVTNFVRSYIPEAELALDNATELTFTLPTQQESGSGAGSGSEARTPLSFFFAKLDLNLSKLRVEGYGVTAPTLEEVFLKLTRLGDRQATLTPELLETERRKLTDTPASEDGDGSETSSRTEATETTMTMDQAARGSRVTGASLKLKQLGALLAKRFHHFRRDWRMLSSLFLLPILFALAGMGFATIRPVSQNMTNLLITPAMYGPNAYVFYKDDSGSELSVKLYHQLYSEPGIGPTCMQNVSLGSPYVCVPPSSSFSEPIVVGSNASCKCEDYVHSCDPEKTRMAPPQRTTRTADILQRLDGFDIPSYLMDTFESFAEKRYGGWSFSTPKAANETDPQVTVWFNNKGYHALPAFLNAHSNNLLRTLVPSNKENYGITLRNHPLSVQDGQLNWETIEQTATDVGIALMLLMAFSFIPAALTIYLVQERESKEKQLQFINGVGNVMYWTAALIWDMFIHILAVGLVTGIIAIFRIPPYFDKLNLAAVFVLLLLFGWAVIPLMYCTLRVFRRASAAYLVLFCTNLFLGIITVIIILVILLFQSNMMKVYSVLRYVFLIFPQFCLSQGLVEIAKNHFVTEIFRRFGEDAYRNPFSLDIIGWHLVAMAIEGLVFFLLTIFIESVRGGAVRVSPSLMPGEEDEEVAAERQRVERGAGQRDVLLVKNLSKVYRRGLGRFLAVDHISFGVGRGECFGLLGVNGAGKTTTFRMMTGDTLPSSGAAYVGNTKISLGDPRVGADVGYCPQQGGLDPYLTPRELLNIAASLKGLNCQAARLDVEELLTTLELTQHADKAIRQCSGGTQRKLSLAIALLGEPRVLFLDEPTTGMDPATRRLAWRCVRRAVRRGQSVVLTSHNMDECEMLCDRLAIMVNGRLVCLGSPQHLKYRFGDGYTVQIHASGLSDNKYTLENALLSQFPGCAVKDKENGLLELSIPRGVTSVSNVFAAMEHARESNILQTYSVSQTTLDTVFITFARAQTDGLGDGMESESGETSSDGGSSSGETGKLAGPFANATYAYTNPAFLPVDPSLGFRTQRFNTITETDGKVSTRL